MRYRRHQSQNPHDTAAQVEALGRRFHAIQADLSHQDDMTVLVDRAVAAMGRVDILVNNAGIIRRHDALTFTESDWDAVIDLNLKAVFFLCRAVASSSFAVVKAGKLLTSPRCSRFRAGSASLLYRLEKRRAGSDPPAGQRMGWRGINVNAIAPGYMATNNTQRCAKMKSVTSNP